jgi:hypothetical protein
LVIPPAKHGEAERETEAVFGKDLAIVRRPNPEKSGSALLLITRGDNVEISEPELACIPTNLSKQKTMNHWILETSEEIDPKNATAAEFLVGLNPPTPPTGK